MNAPTPKIEPFRKFRALLLLAAMAGSAQVASAATFVWNGVNFTTATTNWSDTANWLPTGTPSSADTAVFGVNGTVSDALTINNALTANTTITSLQYTNTTSGTWHVTQIPAGVTLTVTGPTVVGGATASSLLTSAAVVDAGTLSLGGNLNVGNNGSSGADQHTILDLSGLSNFVFNAGSGTINLGTGNRSAADLKLASGSNNITVNVLNANGGSTSGGVSGTLTLGGGTNIINVNLFTNGASRGNGTITFPSGVTGAGLRVRGVAGGDNDRVATLMMGNRNQNTSGGTDNGIFNFNGNTVDMKVATMILGQAAASSPSGNQTGGGIINFDTGIIDATTINMGVSSANAFNVATGLVNVGTSATLVVSNFSLVNQGALGTSTGSLSVDGGTVNCAGNIFKTSTAGTANITVNAGAINLTGGGNIGFATNAIDNLSVTDSRLTLAANLTPAVYATNLTAGGTANSINVTSVPAFFAYPAQFPLISYVNPLGDNNTFVVGTLPGTYSGYISNNTTGLSIDIVITNGPALAVLKSIRWNGTPTGDWTTNTGVLNWLTNSTAVNYNQGDTVTFNDTLTGTPNVNLTMALTPGDLTINNSAASYVFTGTGKISGSTGLTKTGSGTVVIDNTGTNDFFGPVAINAGTLQIGNNDTAGNLPSVGNWDDEGMLAFNRTDNLTLGQVVSGAGNLAQNGSGKLSIIVAQTYTGNTIINNGTLALTGGGALASAAVYPRGGAFDVSTAAPFMTISTIGMNAGGNFVVGTNTLTVTSLSMTNSTITLAANLNGPSLSVTTLATGGATNYINITGIQNPPGGPAQFPIISYGGGTFTGPFNIAETNFPNAYVTNNAANSTIDLVLTTTPYLVTWNGGSAAGNNWSDVANWTDVQIFPGDALTFDGTTRLTPLNDTPANTIYSNITFNGSAGAFTLTGNPVVFTGTLANNSANPQTILLPLEFTNNATINGASGPVIIGAGLTNVSSATTGSRTLTLMGTGILTNLFGSTAAPGGTNGLILNDSAANWTLLDNATSTRVVAPWAFELNNGTFNFGTASSAPTVISTSAQGVPSDNQLGNSATAVLNFSNGVFTTSARFNTGGGSGSGTINQYNGVINIASQFQGANGGLSAVSAVNLFGGTMNIGVSPNSTNSSLLTTNFGTFYVASRGTGGLTITNSALLNCATLDVSRNASGSTGGSQGTVNLDGGTIVASNVGSATANQQTGNNALATFNFNGGTLKARTNSATFFQGRTTAPITPINAYVTARGAFIDSDVYAISFLEPLLTDPNLGGAQDGGLTKLGNGTLTLAGTNTYYGDTRVNAGTLNVTGQGVSATIVANGATLAGNGVIGSNVTVNAGGTLAPGNNGVGVLTVGGNVNLAGTTTVEVDKTALTNDLVQATNVTATTITYGGTLNVVATNGSLAPGDTFKLFDATNYVSAFTTINPANVTWDTSNLSVNGTLKVVSIAPTGPTTNVSILSVTLSGSNLVVHGTNNNVPNTSGNYVVLTATNLTTPLSQWTPVQTNQYSGTGTADFSVPVVPGTPQQFIDVKAQ